MHEHDIVKYLKNKIVLNHNYTNYFYMKFSQECVMYLNIYNSFKVSKFFNKVLYILISTIYI